MGQRVTTERTLGVSNPLRGVVIGCIIGLGAGIPALAQTGTPAARPGQQTNAEARSAFVTVTRDGASLRSGASTVWYSVGALKAGTILRVDGEEDGWLRVQYPSEIPAVVKPGEGDLDRDKGVVRLRRASALWALDHANPRIENAYKQIFAASPVPAGTELRYLGPVNDNAGNLAGFRVQPPSGALGFVLPSDVRAATAEEVARMMPRPAPEETEDAEEATPAPQETTRRPEPTPERETRTPAPAEAADDEQDADATEDAEDAEEQTPENRAVNRLAELDEAYRRVLQQPLLEAEFDDLIAEYEALKASVSGDGPLAESIVASADIRIELLQIRADLQQVQRDLQGIEADQARAAQDLERFVRQAQRSREYTAVGRLLPSTIYSGDQLPRMYRLVSVEGNAIRTIAYVLPTEGLELEGMVGSIVGVRGDSEVGRSERVKIIRPVTADVLRAQ